MLVGVELPTLHIGYFGHIEITRQSGVVEILALIDDILVVVALQPNRLTFVTKVQRSKIIAGAPQQGQVAETADI